MTIAADDVVEASARLEFDAIDDVVNVYQFRLASGGPLTDDEGVDDILEILEVLYTIILGAISTIELFRDIRLFNVTQQILLGLHAWPSLINGGAIADALPPGCAAVVNFSTIVPKVTLRKYFGVFTTGAMGEDGLFTGLTVASVAEAATYLLAPIAATNGLWVYGYISPKILGWVSPNGATNNNIPGYQRRRKQGRGS